jgi:hypothetical protein
VSMVFPVNGDVFGGLKFSLRYRCNVVVEGVVLRCEFKNKSIFALFFKRPTQYLNIVFNSNK